MRQAAILSFLSFALSLSSLQAEPRHGLSVFGDLKYPPQFKHYDYVNPDAPKGGSFSSWDTRIFDSVNPFIVRGVAPVITSESFGVENTFATLMTASRDEPDSVYAYVAESADLSADKQSLAFALRASAKFHDGTPITAADVVFSFETLKREGHPRYSLLLRDVLRAEEDGPKKVRFIFAPSSNRDLPVTIAVLPILSKASFASRKFDETTLVPLLGSGPYKISKVDIGRSISYERVSDWWGKDLPVNRGRFNFHTIRYDFFRDRDIAHEAFFAGTYDFREEFTSRIWATGYKDRPAVQEGRVKLATLSDEAVSGFQAYYFNMRREKFSDQRVRQALSLAFDFEWINKTIFYSAYRRTASIFPNSELAARGIPEEAERALLTPFKSSLPADVFGPAYRPPMTDGSGNLRLSLRQAALLLKDAGWIIRDGRLTSAKTGEVMTIEFLAGEKGFERVNGPFIENLRRLGIEATQRIVETAQYQNRLRDHDFDVITQAYGMSETPGIEQRNFWHSSVRDTPGGFNHAGIADPAVDDLVGKIIKADSRSALITASRALDRVLLWNNYFLPQWYKGNHDIAYWDKFERPAVKPRFGLSVAETWWVDPKKEAQLKK